MAPDRPAAIGLQIADHVLRVVRLEFRDRPRISDAAELRLPPGMVTNGIVVDEPTVVGLLRRLWDQIGLTWEPTFVAIGTTDARLVMLALDDLDACAALAEELSGYGSGLAEEFVVVQLQEASDTDESVPAVIASRASVQRTVGVLERAGVSIAAVDITPIALARTQPASWVDVEDVTLRFEDGYVQWAVRIGANVSTARTWRANAETPAQFDSVRLALDDLTIRPITQLADVEVGDRLRSRFSMAQLAVPVGAALAAGPLQHLPIDLRQATPLSLPRRGEGGGEPGTTWVVEPLAPVRVDGKRRGRR